MVKLKAQTISPQSVKGINNKTEGTDNRRQNSLKLSLLIVLLVLLITGGGGLLYFLSKHPPEPKTDPESSAQPMLKSSKAPTELPDNQPQDRKIGQPAPEPAATSKKQQADVTDHRPPEGQDTVPPDAQKNSAEELLAQFVVLKNRLDQQGASHWGMDAYRRMSDNAARADRLLLDQKYREAAEKYSEAITDAKRLANRTDNTLKQLIEDGQQALQRGDGKSAREKFNIALMIEPANPIAQQGLQRAKTIDAVTQLITSGKAHESENKLFSARADYQQACQLDPESEDARAALNRVKIKIKDRQFRELMSAGLNAYHNNDFQLARTKLLKAKTLKPDSREVQDALTQVDAAIRLHQIEQLKIKAAAFEQSEDWSMAMNSYLQILKIDPNVQFAIQGKKHTLRRIQIAKRFRFYLEKPDRLENEKQLQNASRLLQEVREVEPKGPKLTAQITGLEKHIQDARTPIKVTIKSDNLTDVAVYKVGRLGRFDVRQLDLKPGTYIVVGERDGYKDIRQKVVIKPGQKSLRITIKCTVKI
jgi:hypothetical protein